MKLTPEQKKKQSEWRKFQQQVTETYVRLEKSGHNPERLLKKELERLRQCSHEFAYELNPDGWLPKKICIYCEKEFLID